VDSNGSAYGILIAILTPLCGAVGYLYRETNKRIHPDQFNAKVKECDDLRAIVNAHTERALAQLDERDKEQRIFVEKIARLEAEIAVRMGNGDA
jgi:hypothetical protein